MLGHEVMVYDSNPAAGGMLRYALPDYRLPKDVLDREVELIRRAGVGFTFNTQVPRDISLNDLDSQFDAVFLSIGTWKESWVYLPGTELTGVIPALPFLEGVSKQQPVPLGKRVTVIGGGNAAIDSARTALRLGSKVTIIYRRERKDMPAIPEETEAAEAEGAEIVFLATPHRIVGGPDGRVQAIEAVRTKLGESTPPAAAAPCPPARSSASPAIPSSSLSAKPWISTSPRPRASKSRKPASSRSTAIPSRPAARSSTPAATSSPEPPTSPTPWATARRPRATLTGA
ncbi:MAG: NAD-binding protein [Paludibaculum sp.]